MAALKTVGKASVIDATQVQNGGLHIVNVDRVFSNIPTVIVGRTVDRALLNAPACHPPTEGAAKMIATIRLGGISLSERRAAKLGTPYDQRVF